MALNSDRIPNDLNRADTAHDITIALLNNGDIVNRLMDEAYDNEPKIPFQLYLPDFAARMYIELRNAIDEKLESYLGKND